MEITKPVINIGMLKHDLGNIVYGEKFLKKLAESKKVEIELNEHEGEEIGTVKHLEFKDNALYATMDIPDEYHAEKVAFSIDAVPQKYNKIDSMTFEPTEGVLNKIVYVNDPDKLDTVRDTKTITFLQNLKDEERGDTNMEDKELAKQYGELKAKYDTLKADKAQLEQEFEALKTEKTTIEDQLETIKTELTTSNDTLKVYQDAEAKKKEDLIKSLIKDEEDPRIEIYKKLDISEIEVMAKDVKTDTPPKGVGSTVTDQNNGNQGSSTEEKPYNYQEAKEAMNLR